MCLFGAINIYIFINLVNIKKFNLTQTLRIDLLRKRGNKVYVFGC
jgi:hypothetical protein